MTKRPSSSVTTILAYLVGRSVVSAITHTPASGPFGPRTTPPMSVAPMLTAGALCWAPTDVGAGPSASARASAAAPRYNPRFVVVMSFLHVLHFRGGTQTGPKADRRNAGRLVPVLMGRH